MNSGVGLAHLGFVSPYVHYAACKSFSHPYLKIHVPAKVFRPYLLLI